MISISLLLISSAIALILLIVHSLFLRGARVTFNFFFFAFIWAIRKESSLFQPVATMPAGLIPPYQVSAQGYHPAMSMLVITIGWVFTFYLSWCIAEQVLRRVEYFRGRIFMTLLLSGLVVGSISYSMETTGVNVNWWRWNFFDNFNFHFLLKEYSFTAISAWFFCSVYFLSAFFLIECSKYRNAPWKGIFFLIPFAHAWVAHFFGTGMPMFLERSFFMVSLIILAFLSPLDFENGAADTSEHFSAKKRSRHIKGIPLYVASGMLIITIFLDIFLSRHPESLITKIPLIIFLLLCVRKIPFYFIVVPPLSLIIIGGQKFIPAFVPALFILLLMMLGKLKNFSIINLGAQK